MYIFHVYVSHSSTTIKKQFTLDEYLQYLVNYLKCSIYMVPIKLYHSPELSNLKFTAKHILLFIVSTFLLQIAANYRILITLLYIFSLFIMYFYIPIINYT